MKMTMKAYRLAGALTLALAMPAVSQAAEKDWQPFLQKHCVECHDADTKKGNLDLTALKLELDSSKNFSTWVTVHDRVQSGEMPPPKKKSRPEAGETSAFVKSLSASLTAADAARVAKEGRATQRRLNRFEYEETLRDLLQMPILEVKSYLPEDTEAHGFNKIGDALDVSHVQMARYLNAAESAMRAVMAPYAAQPETKVTRYYTWDTREFAGKIHLSGPLVRRTFPLIGYELQRQYMPDNSPRIPSVRDPKNKEEESMAVVVSTYEPTEIRFGGFRAPVSGKYRLKFCANTVWFAPKFASASPGRRPEPVTIYAEVPPRTMRRIGAFDVNPEPTVREMEVWLHAGETIRPDAARFFRSRPPEHKNPLATEEGSPGLAFRWMEAEGPIISQWPPAGHQVLFGNLPMKENPPRTPDRRFTPPPGVEVVSENPERDAERLLRSFMPKAYRGPVQEEDVQRFLGVIKGALKAGHSFTDAMLAGYTTVLSSPGFIYLSEKPGRLDDRAVAERLSYFLWNTAPDAELRALAAKGELSKTSVLRAQTERLLSDPKSRQFVDAFLDYWLELRLIAGTAPDTELYPDYQIDDLLVESMISESQLFFNELLKRNLGVSNLAASDFVMINERMADHYGIANVRGVDFRPVALTKDNLRGGLLTQASVLKVTANGTTTSPIKRGAWIMSRVLGRPPPPPPASVSAVEPDTRGATTIREQLAKHRDQETCAACHKKIDPPGFALESFDVMGAHREKYRAIGGEGAPIEGTPVKGIGHNGLTFRFCLGPAVDPSGEMPEGGTFKDVRELKQLLLRDQEQLARNLTRQLAIYATGAPIRFSDRPKVEKILAQSKGSGYGVRTLVHEIVQSDLFLEK